MAKELLKPFGEARQNARVLHTVSCMIFGAPFLDEKYPVPSPEMYQEQVRLTTVLC
jgi:hypothetical protein